MEQYSHTEVRIEWLIPIQLGTLKVTVYWFGLFLYKVKVV